MVVNNKTLSDAQRTQLLKSYVEGEVENLIRDLTIADANFTSAWERITGRYNNKRVVVYKHLSKIMNQKVIQTEAKSVKKLLDTTDQTMLALKNLERPVDQSKKEEITNAVGIVNTQEITTAVAVFNNEKQVLLATALIATTDFYGRKIVLRALIDQGSQGSMITKKAANMFQLEQTPTSKYISGLGDSNTGRIKQINLIIKPRFNSEIRINIECYILKKLTKILPDSNLNVEGWNYLKELQLAEPTYHKMGPIDIILGTDVVMRY